MKIDNTAVHGPGRRAASRPSSVGPDARRRSAVYGITTVAVDRATGLPIPGQVEVGYIGKSVQTVKQRELQHRSEQPFSDLIVGGSWTIEEGWWTPEELADRERWYIRNGATLFPGQPPQRPRYNHDENLDYPGRIEIWRAIEHRQAREPGWTPPPKGEWIPQRQGRRRQPVRPVVRSGQSWVARWWVRRRWWVIGLASVWLVLFVAGLWVSGRLWGGGRPLAAATGATAPFLLMQGEIWRQRVRKWWRRMTRPRRRYPRRGRR